MSSLWILVPAPFVGYLVIEHFCRLFSEDRTLARTLIWSQPVTMIAAATALGAVVVWSLFEIGMRLFRPFF